MLQPLLAQTDKVHYTPPVCRYRVCFVQYTLYSVYRFVPTIEETDWTVRLSDCQSANHEPES